MTVEALVGDGEKTELLGEVGIRRTGSPEPLYGPSILIDRFQQSLGVGSGRIFGGGLKIRCRRERHRLEYQIAQL